MKFLLMLLFVVSCSSKPEYSSNEYEDEDFKTLMEMADSSDISLKKKKK